MHLPLAVLRMAMELDFPELLNHDGQLGLGLSFPPDPIKIPTPFAGFQPSADLAERLNHTVADWVDQALTRYITHNQLPLLLQINLHKRIGSLGLKEGYTSHDSTTGYLLDHQFSPPRAFAFGVIKDRNGWRLDDDYAVLARHFPELQQSATPQQLIDLPATGSYTVFIARHQAVEDKHPLELDAGVPERDKIGSFERVRDALAPLGFTPFTGFDPRRCKGVKADDLRMDAAVLIAELMQVTTVPRLFRIGASHAEIYWSLAKPQGNYKRGESCYRQIDLADTRKDKDTDERITRLVRHAPVINRQTTLNAVEFTVLGRPETDDPDAIACCAEQLRSGSIQARTETALRHPLPLAVMDILKKYM